MDITEAYEVLGKYYSKQDLRFIYQQKKFDASETDSYKKLDYNAELLKKEAIRTSDKNEQRKCFDAVTAFEKAACEGRYLM